MTRERRRNRSKFPATALQLQLRHCVKLFGVDSMSLGDNRGLVVASSDSSEASEVLAAFAPLIHGQRKATQRGKVLASFKGFLPKEAPQKVSVRRFEVGGEDMFLCALGERGINKDLAVRRGLRGVRRILAV
jgi:hypothetical protein